MVAVLFSPSAFLYQTYSYHQDHPLVDSLFLFRLVYLNILSFLHLPQCTIGWMNNLCTTMDEWMDNLHIMTLDGCVDRKHRA